MKKPIAIVSGIVIVAALGGLGWWVYGQNTSSQTDSQESTQTESAASNKVSTKNLIVFSTENKDLAIFVSSIQLAGLTETLQGPGPYTVLAPMKKAFEALPTGMLATLQKSENKAKLADILKYHVLQGAVTTDQLTDGQKIKTVEGGELVVEKKDKTVYLVDAKGGKAMIEKADYKVSNGVVHTVNAVLLPQ